ncbi:MAG: PilC/PilY family type IV pilus protein [Thermodesulfobacteriota bacterium]
MTTMRKPAAWLALLLCCLVALPPSAPADDTELFTTAANPNVLLMLDTTGSMDTSADLSVGDLDGDSPSGSRMDILWKVIYTLLNADLSTPTYDNTATGTARGELQYAKRTDRTTLSTSISDNRYYEYIIVYHISASDWALFPGGPSSGGTVRIGSWSTNENVTYTRRSSGSPYTLYFDNPPFDPGKRFNHDYNQGARISYTYTIAGGEVPYPENFPTNNTEAESTDFRNNLTTEDENILKARLGLMTFTTYFGEVRTLIRDQIYPSDNNVPPFNTSYRDIWDSTTNYAHASGGTPTAQALNAAKNFFNVATSGNTVDICRQNFAVLVTDGEDTIGGLDGSSGTGAGPDYYDDGVFNADGWSGNTGQVARNNSVIQRAYDLKNYSPPVNVFTVGVGISDNTKDKAVLREVLRRAGEQENVQATVAQYNSIGASGDNTARAANKAFFATDASQLSVALRNIFQQITAGMYSFTAPTVASVRMTDRNYLYKASFTPSPPPATFWQGHLQALTINSDNTISSPLWDASDVLDNTAAGSRRIYTAGYDNTNWSRVEFTTGSVTPAMLAVDNTAARDTVVNYVRGVDRADRLGDIFHSKPVVVGPPSQFYFDTGYSSAAVVGGTLQESFTKSKAKRKRVIFVGTNDGMLHGFLGGEYDANRTPTPGYDTGTGEEVFAYVPRMLLEKLEEFVPAETTRHGYYVDSSPRVADVWIDANSDGIKVPSEWRTVLISGLRKGGNGYFALDVTDPGNGKDSTDFTNYPKVLWEYQGGSTLGQSWSEPFIGKVKVKATSASAETDRWVAVFGGGQADSTSTGQTLTVLDISTGTALKIFSTGIDNAIVASPTAVLDPNGYIRFVYVSDLDGSLYKFRFTTPGVSSDLYSQWDMKKIFQAPAGSQPVYHRVEYSASTESTRRLFFGTGDQEFPVSNLGTGKFYSVDDSDGFWPDSPLTEANLSDLSLSITNPAGGTIASGRVGWYVNFASVPSTSVDNNTHTGEKVLSDPVVFFNAVYFTTFTPDVGQACGGGGIARVYGLNILNAGAALGGIASLGETETKVPYHVYTGSGEGTAGGIPSSPSLSVYPSGQSSIFVGFSTGAVEEIKVESPPQMKNIKAWKETF